MNQTCMDDNNIATTTKQELKISLYNINYNRSGERERERVEFLVNFICL